MKKIKKPGNNIGREDSAGQCPFWPGEGMQNPNTIVEGENGEKTIIPIVDSIEVQKGKRKL